MSRTERLQIRISPELKEKVEGIAKERNISVSELLVDYIKRLPYPKAECWRGRGVSGGILPRKTRLKFPTSHSSLH